MFEINNVCVASDEYQLVWKIPWSVRYFYFRVFEYNDI